MLRNSSDFWCSFEINDTITLSYRYPHMQNHSAAIWDTAAKQLQKCQSFFFLFPPTMNTSSPPGDQSTFKWGWFSFRKGLSEIMGQRGGCPLLWNHTKYAPGKISWKTKHPALQPSACAFLAYTQMPLGGITPNVDVQHRCSVHVQYTQHFHTWLTLQTCKVNPNISWSPGLALWVSNKSTEHAPYCQHLKGEVDLLPTCSALALTCVSKTHRNPGYKYYCIVG